MVWLGKIKSLFESRGKLVIAQHARAFLEVACIVTVLFLLFKSKYQTIYVYKVDPQNIESSQVLLERKLQGVDAITISDKVDWFLAGLGVFSTVLLGLIVYTVFSSLEQQREIREYMSDIRKNRDAAEQDANVIHETMQKITKLDSNVTDLKINNNGNETVAYAR